MGRAVGSVLTIEFKIDGHKFGALNGGPLFKFNESISFVVNCEAQEEVDYFWGKLTANGGQESACGWVKDRFGCRGKSYRLF
jgi:predicted 3-demethylubiquinone-9 3-methyltransferase (glyoxalase superfamily)